MAQIVSSVMPLKHTKVDRGLGLTFVFKCSQFKPKIRLRAFMNFSPDAGFTGVLCVKFEFLFSNLRFLLDLRLVFQLTPSKALRMSFDLSFVLK